MTRRCRAWSSRASGRCCFGVFVLSAVAFLYFVLPKLTGGTSESIHGLGDGKPGWLVVALAASRCLSFCGYVLLFRTVFVRGKSRIDWRASYEITMAGRGGDAPVRGGRRRRRSR